MRFRIDEDGRSVDVEVVPATGGYRVRVGDRWLDAEVAQAGPFSSVIVDGRSYEVAAAERDGTWVTHSRGQLHRARIGPSRRRTRTSAGTTTASAIRAPMPGRVLKVAVVADQLVEAGQPVIVIEAMKMQNELRAPRSGRVRLVAVAEGDAVETGAILVDLE